MTMIMMTKEDYNQFKKTIFQSKVNVELCGNVSKSFEKLTNLEKLKLTNAVMLNLKNMLKNIRKTFDPDCLKFKLSKLRYNEIVKETEVILKEAKQKQKVKDLNRKLDQES